MKIITAPQQYEPQADIFLAGGISNCPLWQDEAILLLANTEGVAYNPRRPGKLVAEEAIPQIEWEYYALRNVRNILFWFPEETLCPITLYELGVFSQQNNVNLFVGTHPNYQRRLDVVTQLHLARPEISVYTTLEDTVENFINFITD
jgi:hypothetical protein